MIGPGDAIEIRRAATADRCAGDLGADDIDVTAANKIRAVEKIFEAEDAAIVDANFERLVVRRSEEIDSCEGSAVAADLPESGGIESIEEIRVESTTGRGASCVAHINRAGRGRHGLARAEDGQRTRAIRAHGNSKPSSAAVSVRIVRSEIQEGGEQSVADAHGGVGDRSEQGAATGGIFKPREREIVSAVGRRSIGIEPALISESRALGEKIRRAQRGREKNDGSFHNE